MAEALFPVKEPKRCKDCKAENPHPKRWREAPYPGPRCKTHHYQRKRDAGEKQHRAQVNRTYSFQEADHYDRLYKLQDGKCAICARATGKTKRLAVDHDHSCCNGPTSCGFCIRGLLCSTCNQFLGHVRNNPQAFARGVAYLLNPPAQRLLREYARELLADE